MSVFDIELVNQTESAVDENRLISTAGFALEYLRMNPDTAL